MRRFLYFIILSMSLTLGAVAQVKVKGRVVDLENKPVSDVIVKLVSGTKMIAFATTDAQGYYAMEFKEMSEGKLALVFNHISFEKEEVSLSLKETAVTQDMVLTPKPVALKEVVVRPDPLRQKGDTLSHNLASFLGKGDVTLEDGLKRLPGVDVSKNGGISYMGTPISQFNIEGMDLLGGKYNLATRNIPADYVTQVEIVRNHHSRRVEKDVPTDEVSMNIKLSNKAKFKPFGQEEAGAGIAYPHPTGVRGEGLEVRVKAGAANNPNLSPLTPNQVTPPLGWDRGRLLLGLTGMMFTNKFQTICSVKGGNYKGFARADMYDHFGGSDVSTCATSLFGGFDGGAPPQGEYLY